MRKLFSTIVLLLVLAAPLGALTLNDRGQVAMGAGGLPGSVDGQIIPDAMGIQWLTADGSMIVYPAISRPSIMTRDMRTGIVTEVAPRGANDLMAGGGVWATWTAGFGLWASTGLFLEHAGLVDVGPDGAIAYAPNRQSGIGVNVRERDGSDWRLSDGIVYDLQLLGARRAIWRNELHQIQTVGIPRPLQIGGIWRPRATFVRGQWWVSYFSGSAGVVLHPFDSLFGYVIAGPGIDAFSHDIVALNDQIIRNASARRAGELPEDLRLRDINIDTETRVNLSVTTPPPPPPPPTEVCGDRIDNDADGLVDEECPTEPQQPTFNYDLGPLNTFAQTRWNDFPHYTREQQAKALFRILYEFRAQGHPEIEVFRKCDAGQSCGTVFTGSDGHHYAEDIVVINLNGVKWWSDVGVRFGLPEASLAFDHQAFVDNLPTTQPHRCFAPPAPSGHTEPPPPEDVKQLKQRIKELEGLINGLATEITGLKETIGHLQTGIGQALQERDDVKRDLDRVTRELNDLKNKPAPRCEMSGPGWVRSAFGIRCTVVQ